MPLTLVSMYEGWGWGSGDYKQWYSWNLYDVKCVNKWRYYQSCLVVCCEYFEKNDIQLELVSNFIFLFTVTMFYVQFYIIILQEHHIGFIFHIYSQWPACQSLYIYTIQSNTMASNFIYIHSDQPVSHYIYRCLSGKLWYLPQNCVGDTIFYHWDSDIHYTMASNFIYIHSDQPVNYYIYPSKKSGLFFTTIFTQFSSNAHPVLI